jgi:hypothetical protein
MRPLVRPALLLAALAGPLLTAATAAAQDAGATSFNSMDFFIGVQETLGANISNFDIARYFNKARCDCTQKVYIYVALTNSGFAKRTTVDRSGNIEFWIGSDCANTTLGRQARCKLLGAPTLAAFLSDGRATLETDARVMSTYTGAASIDGGVSVGLGDVFMPTQTCASDLESFSQNIYVLQATTGTPATLATRQVTVDLKPPPRMDPGLITLDGVNQAVVLSWPGIDSSVITDMLGYQVLCNRAGEFQVFGDGTFGDPGYLMCPGSIQGSGLPALDPRYLCSDLLAPTARSHRIKILQNDIAYAAGVVAIDRSGNPSVLDIFYAKATKSQTFYDVYRDGDMNTEGRASGGFCALGPGATGRGAASGLGAAIAIAAVAVVRRRRRRR